MSYDDEERSLREECKMVCCMCAVGLSLGTLFVLVTRLLGLPTL